MINSKVSDKVWKLANVTHLQEKRLHMFNARVSLLTINLSNNMTLEWNYFSDIL